MLIDDNTKLLWEFEKIKIYRTNANIQDMNL